VILVDDQLLYLPVLPQKVYIFETILVDYSFGQSDYINEISLYNSKFLKFTAGL